MASSDRSNKNREYTARKATEADIPALKEITGHDESRRLCADGRSYHPENCMMVVEKDGVVIGSLFVVFVRPPLWPDADDTSQLPQLISVVVETKHRNRGAGTFLIQAAEEEAKSRGLTSLYIAVNPEENPGALRLYRRLGFEAISEESYRSTYTYTDKNGVTVEEVEWLVDMVKEIANDKREQL